MYHSTAEEKNLIHLNCYSLEVLFPGNKSNEIPLTRSTFRIMRFLKSNRVSSREVYAMGNMQNKTFIDNKSTFNAKKKSRRITDCDFFS